MPKAAFTERPYLRILYTDMRIEFLVLLICFILPFTEHAYFSMRIFHSMQRIKYGHSLRIFQAFIKKFFVV